MASQQDSDRPKRIVKRTPASCAPCRRRRTRCDRLWPCSECEKRQSDCDYEGARTPLILARRRFNNAGECEEYIQQLEGQLKALEQAKLADSSEKVPAAIDFANVDLAFHLSRVTLGPRIRSFKPSALETEANTLLAKLPTQPTPAVFLPEPTFNLSLIPTGPSNSLSDLQESLPPRIELTELATYYFQTHNDRSYAVEPSSWEETLQGCYQTRERAELSAEDIHRLATVLIVAAHGLLFRASVHKSDSKAKLNDTARAHRLTNLALGALTQPDQGAILTRPSVWGIRAMVLSATMEFSLEDLDHALFFWKLTSSLAGSVGLFREPPGWDSSEVDDVELESRRHLAWSVLTLDWASGAIVGEMRQPVDLAYYAVKLPGQVGCEADPKDGWPLDPVIAMRQAFALCDRVVLSLTMLMERSASYDELLEVEQQLIQLEQKLPERLQIVISPDKQSIQPKLALNPHRTMQCYLIWTRLMSSRVRLHRPFIFLKEGIPDTERSRHLQELERACRIHLLILMSDCIPHDYLTHGVVMFSNVNTTVACALMLVACPNLFDSTFFLPHMSKLVDLMKECSPNTISSGLAQRAVVLLEKLMNQAEQFSPAPEQFHNPSSTAESGLDEIDVDQFKHKAAKPVSLLGSEPVCPTSLAQPLESKETEQRQIVPLKRSSLISSPPQERPYWHQEVDLESTHQACSVPQIAPIPSEALFDLSRVGEFPFTFRSPSAPPPPSDTSSSSRGLA